MKRFLALGAGVQSTTTFLMAIAGEIEPVDAAIFADTGWEPAKVYEHLEKLKVAAIEAGIPLHVVSAGNIRRDHVDPPVERTVRNPRKFPEHAGRTKNYIPFYVVGEEGQRGIVGRMCTKTYKIEPVERKIRDLLGLTPGQRWPTEPAVAQIFGISWDETQRMRDSRRPAIVNEYPLVDRRMTRQDCHVWLAAHGWTAPRSACIGCPYHRNDEWRHIRDTAPDEWADAVDFDHEIRKQQSEGRFTMRGTVYLHDQRVPLDEANIEDPDRDQLSLFGDECEGMCGV